MKKTIIIKEGQFDPFEYNGDIIWLHTIKPEFFKWNGRKFENIFVGVCSVKINDCEMVIYSLPKYFSDKKCVETNLDEIKRTLKKIVRVVEKLKSEKKNSNIFFETDSIFEPYNLQNEKNNVNRMELAEYLIEDYIQNGLYIKDTVQTRKNGVGRISWNKTVSKVMPIVQSDEILYLDCINKEHIIDDNDIISVIHANVINQCLDLIGPLLSGMVMPIDDKEILEMDLSGYANLINAQSSYVFREREINLFKALEAWCRQTRFYEDYIGVIYFDRVWEWVNDAVWGNVVGIKSDRPKYFFNFDDGYGYKGTGNAIPDTVRVVDNDDGEKTVYVFDSKYYIIKYLEKREDDKEEIVGWPANADIAKQIEYLELLKYLINQTKEGNHINTRINYRNAFLLPEYNECISENEKKEFALDNTKWYKRIGCVKQGSFNNLIKKIIGENVYNYGEKLSERIVDVIIIRPEVLYDNYLNNRKITSKELSDIWC